MWRSGGRAAVRSRGGRGAPGGHRGLTTGRSIFLLLGLLGDGKGGYFRDRR